MRTQINGAPRAKQGADGTAARMAAAQDLVQRTLAQHGLGAPGGGAQAVGPDLPGLSRLSDVLSGGLPGGAGAGLQGLMARLSPHGGAAADMQGMVAGEHSCAAGRRAYRLYLPETGGQGLSGLVVMLHGCTQTPEDFAAGTGMNALADRHGFAVLYPAQSRGDNAQSCWNWFSAGDQRRDRGEPAILAGMAQQVAQDHDVPTGRICVAGLSAGAAMAVILGETYPEIFAAVGAHSGLPRGAARDVPSAFSAMAGNGPDVAAPVVGAQSARMIVFHGSTDATVHPVNGERIYRHALNRTAGQTLMDETRGTLGGRSYHRQQVSDANGAILLEHWSVQGLGHAWSGGQAAGSYTDAAGPDASAEMITFFYPDLAGEPA